MLSVSHLVTLGYNLQMKSEAVCLQHHVVLCTERNSSPAPAPVKLSALLQLLTFLLIYALQCSPNGIQATINSTVMTQRQIKHDKGIV